MNAATARATDRELARQVQYLKNENRVLRARLPRHIVTTPSERARLLKYGRSLGPAINQLITIVVPSTFHRWVREAKGQTRKKTVKISRPKKPFDLKRLVLKIARETGWGDTRVLGEIRKLARHRISQQTLANIMRETGLEIQEAAEREYLRKPQIARSANAWLRVPQAAFAAMANHRLGMHAEAKEFLAIAQQAHDELGDRQGKTTETTQFIPTDPRSWQCRLTLSILRCEAEALISGSTSPSADTAE